MAAVSLDERLKGLLSAAWPEGLPEDELRGIARLSLSRRVELSDRLEAVLRWTKVIGDEKPSAPVAARIAGVSPSHFYSIAAAWRARRTLAALGTRAVGKPPARTRADRPMRQALISAASRILESEPGLGISEVGHRLSTDGLPAPSEATLRRVVLEARRGLPPGPFGRTIVFDSAGLDASMGGLRLRLHVVLDRGSGLVLGWAYATNRSLSWGNVWAAEEALEMLPKIDLGGLVPSEASPTVEMHFQASDEAGFLAFQRAARRHGVPFTASMGTVGRSAIETLGETLGGIWLGLGEREDHVSYRNGRRAALPERTEELGEILSEAFRKHNVARLAALNRRGGHVATLEQRRADVGAIMQWAASMRRTLSRLPTHRLENFLS